LAQAVIVQVRDDLRRQTQAAVHPGDRTRHDRRVALVEDPPGESHLASAWAQGTLLSADEAVEMILTVNMPSGAPSQAVVLTSREHEVAQLVARGSTNREIAETLVISERTAETHVTHILEKLRLRSRVQNAAWVHQQPADSGSDSRGNTSGTNGRFAEARFDARRPGYLMHTAIGTSQGES
jgi:non-specific serine/threonine protein kinase